MDKIIEKNILAIEPVYIKDKGNCTRVYTEKNEDIAIHKTIRTVINNICKYYHFDIKESKKTYGELLNLKKFPPIPFNSDNVFIYIKMRKPRCIHDGAYGYVKLDEIYKLKEEKDNTTKIYLRNGNKIKSLSTINTINKRINNGRTVKQLSKGKDNRVIKENESYYIDKDELATKKDIALIYMEMMKIKNIIKE